MLPDIASDMKTNSKNTTTVTNLLKTIADDKSLVLFNTIALSNGDTDIFINILGLTRKQYYSRLHALLKAGLVKREGASILLPHLV